MLDGSVTDAVEAASFSHNINHIDIYAVQWGPQDNGRVVDGPGALMKHALQNSIKNVCSVLNKLIYTRKK